MRILWGDDAHIFSRSVYDFFLLMFPTHMLADFAFWTSTMLKDAGKVRIASLLLQHEEIDMHACSSSQIRSESDLQLPRSMYLFS